MVGSNQVYQLDYKKALIRWFFKSNDRALDGLKQDFLKGYGIDYLYYSPQEEKMGLFSPADKDYLKEIYRNDWVKIYAVVKTGE